MAAVFNAGWGQILRAGKGSFLSVGTLTDLVIVLALVKNFSENHSITSCQNVLWKFWYIFTYGFFRLVNETNWTKEESYKS